MGRLVWAVAFACLLAATGVQAMEFRIHPNSAAIPAVTAVLAVADVVDGDVERLTTFLATQPLHKTTAIYLASPGGSLFEGMRLGRFFKVAHIKTVVEGGQICASACALAFLGGHDNDGNPWRSSSTTSLLGFHAFATVGPAAPDENTTQLIVSQVLQYGKDVGAPLELLILGFATPSDDIYWLNQTEICSLGIKLWDVVLDKFIC